MERKLLERMLGAGALVAALVIIGPLLLDGKSGLPARPDDAGGSASSDEFQTHTVTLRPRGSTGSPAGVENVPPRPVSAAAPAPLPAAAAGPAVMPTVSSVAPQSNVRDAGQPGASIRAPATPLVPPMVRSAAAIAEPAPAAPSAVVGGWAVQLGTFAELGNAERLAQEIAGRGFTAFVSPFKQSGKSLYRVRVGPVREKAAAEDLARKLAEAGHAGPVVTN